MNYLHGNQIVATERHALVSLQPRKITSVVSVLRTTHALQVYVLRRSIGVLLMLSRQMPWHTASKILTSIAVAMEEQPPPVSVDQTTVAVWHC